MKFPNELYVVIEGQKQDEFFDARENATDFAVAGDIVTAMLYRKVGTVSIKAPVEVIQIAKNKPVA